MEQKIKAGDIVLLRKHRAETAEKSNALNEQKAKEIAAKYCEYYDGSKEADSTSYNSAMEMAKWKDEQYNEVQKDILTLVKLIPCNEGNESIINDIKNLLK